MPLPALQPFIKWVGSKRRLAPHIVPYIPDGLRLVEPFAGSGAVMLAKQPQKAWLNDTNTELINLWRCIKYANIDDFVNRVHEHCERMDGEYFYWLRDLDRHPDYPYNMSDIDRAARYITVISNAFGGIDRRDQHGHCTINYGHTSARDPWKAVHLSKLCKNVRAYLDNAEVTITNFEYGEVLDRVQPGDFVYFDPPYYTYRLEKHNRLYAREWGAHNLEQLFEHAQRLTSQGIPIAMSNSSHSFVRDLFHDWHTIPLNISYTISSKGKNPRKATEALYVNKHV